MWKVWHYKILTPLCLAMAIGLPLGIELGGFPSDGWRIFCWVFAPIPLVGLFVGAQVHMMRVHIAALEKEWTETSQTGIQYTVAGVQTMQQAIRNEPWFK